MYISCIFYFQLSSAFRSRIQTAAIINLGHIELQQFLEESRPLLKKKIIDILKILGPIKLNVKLCAIYELPSTGEEDYKYFVSSNKEILTNESIEAVIQQLFEIILSKSEEFQHRGSGWKYVGTSFLLVCINKFSPLNGATYISLPSWLQNRGLINIKNNDNRCFVWSVLAHLYPVNIDKENVLSYPQSIHDFLHLQDIEMPVKISDISKFERQNPNISINVFGIDNHSKLIIGPLYHTKQVKTHHINLLYFKSNTYSKFGHYCYISDLSKLICNQVVKGKRKILVCDLCLNHFRSEHKFKIHIENCSLFDPVRITVPDLKNNNLKFNSFKALLMKPFVIYADFECFTVPIDYAIPNPLLSFTTAYQNHQPYSAAYYVVCSFNENFNKFNLYRGENVSEWFVENIQNECENIQKILKQTFSENKKLFSITREQEAEFLQTTSCSICDCMFSSENNKVHHHDHYTGKFIAGICNNCNLQIQTDNSVPVFFHNLNYDMNMFLKVLAQKSKNISILPLSHEKYISFSAYINQTRITFLDSFRFLSASLDELVQNLAPESLEPLKTHFRNEHEYLLAIRKGVFPYDFVTGWESLTSTCLPSKEKFYSKLKQESISDENYNHAKNVWNTFQVQNLGEFSDIYLKTDVLLLSVVFENFRSLAFKYYGLDPSFFVSLPSFSWAAALKMIKINLSLLTDIDQILFIEKGIRGGITQVTHRYAACNNPYYSPSYDCNKPAEYLMYFDVNNLYGWAQCQNLPYANFRWLEDYELEILEYNLIFSLEKVLQFYGSSKEKSVILEVDFAYPKNIHDKHKDMPFCPEHKICAKSSNQKKLVCTVQDKLNYVIHFENLCQCLKHGLQLKKVHRVLEFSQTAWLKPYIEFNTEKRIQAKSVFEKNFFKLLINANFGKTIERDRKKRDIKLVNNWNSARKYLSKPEFKDVHIYSENLISIELNKTNILFNKPIYAGFTILELSKSKMYDFYYDFVLEKISPYFHSQLCYMDTDSFIFKFTIADKCLNSHVSIYDLIRAYALEYFDTSEYDEQNAFNIPLVNKKVPGLMKDELNGNILTHFIGLRAKVYDYKIFGIDAHPKIKGVSRSATKKITFQDFYDCLFECHEQKMSTFHTIRSKNHETFSLVVNKCSLDAFDDKRYICMDKITTLPWGHYAIKK